MGNSETRGFDSSRPENPLRQMAAREDRERKFEQAPDIRPNGNITLNAQGVLQCDSLIANHVVGACYTPGTGDLY